MDVALTFMKTKFSLPSDRYHSFSPSRIFVFVHSFKLQNAFFEVFLPWIRTSENIFWSFRGIWTRKTSKNTFRSFCTWIKLEYWGVKKSYGGEENLSLKTMYWPRPRPILVNGVGVRASSFRSCIYLSIYLPTRSVIVTKRAR
jgi:hypothetical protein